MAIAAIGFLRQKKVQAISDSRIQLFFQRVCCTRKPRNVSGTTVSQTAVDWYTTRWWRSSMLVSARSSPNVASRPRKVWVSQRGSTSIRRSRR